jgi:hypothetical protein
MASSVNIRPTTRAADRAAKSAAWARDRKMNVFVGMVLVPDFGLGRATLGSTAPDGVRWVKKKSPPARRGQSGGGGEWLNQRAFFEALTVRRENRKRAVHTIGQIEVFGDPGYGIPKLTLIIFEVRLIRMNAIDHAGCGKLIGNDGNCRVKERIVGCAIKNLKWPIRFADAGQVGQKAGALKLQGEQNPWSEYRFAPEDRNEFLSHAQDYKGLLRKQKRKSYES